MTDLPPRIRHRRFYRVVFTAAGIYNIVWGLYSSLDPQWLFRFARMPLANQPAIFAWSSRGRTSKGSGARRGGVPPPAGGRPRPPDGLGTLEHNDRGEPASRRQRSGAPPGRMGLRSCNQSKARAFRSSQATSPGVTPGDCRRDAGSPWW